MISNGVTQLSFPEDAGDVEIDMCYWTFHEFPTAWIDLSGHST